MILCLICTLVPHTNYDLLRYANAEVAQQLYLIKKFSSSLAATRKDDDDDDQCSFPLNALMCSSFLSFSGNANGVLQQ